MNGRIDILSTNIQQDKPFDLYSDNQNVNFYKKNSLKSIQTNSLLSTTFFSEDNFEQLQNMIRYNVYLQSNKRHIIDRQSNTQLQIIMRSIYLQNAKNLDTNINGQIRELNKLVLDYCIPNILSGLEQYLQYKKSVSTLPEPLPLAKPNINPNNNKELDMTKALFF